MSRSDRNPRKATSPRNPSWNIEPPIEALEPRVALTAGWQSPDLIQPEPITASDDSGMLTVQPPAEPSAPVIADAGATLVDVAESAALAPALDDLAGAAPGAPVGVVQDGQGVVVAAFNESDSLTSFDLEGDELTWSVDDGIPGRSGDAVYAGYRDPNLGEARLVVVGNAGLRLLGRDKAGGLVEIPGPSPLIARAVTAFVSADARAHIVGLRDDGVLLVSYERLVPGENGLERQWTTADLSEYHFGRRGIETPRFAGALTSFATPWGGMNILGADVDGQVWSVWWAPGMRLWTATNLSQAAHDEAFISGNLVGMGTPWGSMHVFGTDAQGHLRALSWSGSRGPGGWTSEDLTRTSGGPSLRAGTLTGFRSSWNTLSVFGLDEAGDVRATWWTPRAGRWMSESVSAELPSGSPRIAGPLSGFIARDGTQNLVGTTDAGNIVRLSWIADGADAWHAEDLTARARGQF